jgi:imidazolonepropionase-like amidohydrolase
MANGLGYDRALRAVTLDAARILGIAERFGSLEAGKVADLVLLKGDLSRDPTVIRNPALVFKDGVGYDPAKLIASVEGRVGID